MSYMCSYCSAAYKDKESMRRCINKHRNRFTEDIPSPYTKKKIPPLLRFQIWQKYVGNKLETLCFCCNDKKITPFTSYKSFQAGHIVSESKGGTMDIGNLLPICSSCNKKMGTTHWDDYVSEKKYLIRVWGDNIPEIYKQSVLLIQNVYKKYKTKTKNKTKTKKIKFKKKNKKKPNYLKPTLSSILKRKKIIF